MTDTRKGYYSAEACDLSSFANIVQRDVSRDDIPLAVDAPKNVPVYDMATLRETLQVSDQRRALMAEWAHILQHGAGVLVLKSAYADTAPIDAATKVYDEIIEREKKLAGGGADHFAAAGTNDRIWNSLQKLCETAPEVFVRYFANPAIDAVCEAWLGPNYQMTAQINVVHPGGDAQQAHRDYHLGFQTADVCAHYPAHVHDLSPLMTLQGGVAHCDMPIESGPTKLLPFSQLYRPGYAAWRKEEFRDYFEAHHVQLPLQKGDALFFNPALFHAAGANTSADIHRMVNLLQVSSAFGRAMESVDRVKMCLDAFEPMRRCYAAGDLDAPALDAVIAATAEGYSFPTNLDRDPPAGGLAPQTQAAVLKEAVTENWPLDKLEARLREQVQNRKP